MAEEISISEKLQSTSLDEGVLIDDYKWDTPLYCDLEENYLDDLEDSDDEEEQDTLQPKKSSNNHTLSGIEIVPAAVVQDATNESQDVTYEEMYRSMYLTSEGPCKKPLHVTINYEELSAPWTRALEYGIREIELAAPGLKFVPTSSKSVNINVTMVNENSKTSGSLRFSEGDERCKVEIFLTEDYSSARRKGTATHELLHALGFEHEQQRRDSGHYIVVYHHSKKDESIVKHKYYKPLTPFDRYSIMLYKVGHYFYIKGDTTEKSRVHSENRQMSELDKIALNMIYSPSERSDYQPKQSSHGMFYCGRNNGVMKSHNQPTFSDINRCGPNSGPNCAACRVLSKPHNLGERWQGRSNYVYCNFNGCGPHINLPCEDCLKLVGM